MFVTSHEFYPKPKLEPIDLYWKNINRFSDNSECKNTANGPFFFQLVLMYRIKKYVYYKSCNKPAWPVYSNETIKNLPKY